MAYRNRRRGRKSDVGQRVQVVRPRGKRADDKPQEERQHDDVDERPDTKMLKDARVRVFPPAAYAHEPGEQEAEHEVPAVEPA